MNVLKLISLLVVLITSGNTRRTGILVPPTSRVAALNSTATFNCVGSGYTLYWRIDGLRDNDPTIKERGIHAVNPDPDDTFNSTLTVPAIIENNKTVIQCVVAVVNGSSGQKIESPTVALLIQGILAPPSNLAIDRDNQRLTWTPPFTLNITDVDPDITYSVCRNVTINCNSTTNPYYDFPTLCDPVEFTVTAVNPVGESEPRSIVFNPICAQSTSGLKRTTLGLSNGGGTSMSLTPTQASTVSTTLSGSDNIHEPPTNKSTASNSSGISTIYIVLIVLLIVVGAVVCFLLVVAVLCCFKWLLKRHAESTTARQHISSEPEIPLSKQKSDTVAYLSNGTLETDSGGPHTTIRMAVNGDNIQEETLERKGLGGVRKRKQQTNY